MTHRSSFAIGVLAAALALPVAVSAQHGKRRIDVPELPAILEVPAGNQVYLEGRAEGTQNYICLATPTGVAWKFLGPQATLFLPRIPQQITTHFLSVNPAEGIARPTWQHSLDSSAVWGRVLQTSNDANYVAPGSIPWLLVEAAGTAEGPLGGSQLSKTTFIQRVNTAGGVAPAVGCTSAANVGAVVLVPYATDYFFYRAKGNK